MTLRKRAIMDSRNEGVSKITVWNRWSNGVYVHNHIEDGWVHGDKPTPKSDGQQSWLNADWSKHYAYLVNNVVTFHNKGETET
jgi:hypothetical protein